MSNASQQPFVEKSPKEEVEIGIEQLLLFLHFNLLDTISVTFPIFTFLQFPP